MEYLLIISLVSMLLIIYSYTLGIKNAIKMIKKEDIKLGFENMHFKEKGDKEESEETEKFNTLLENINNYEPRGSKQKDVL